MQESKVGLRWRTEREVVVGKGQFACGAKGCDERRALASYEVSQMAFCCGLVLLWLGFAVAWFCCGSIVAVAFCCACVAQTWLHCMLRWVVGGSEGNACLYVQ